MERQLPKDVSVNMNHMLYALFGLSFLAQSCGTQPLVQPKPAKPWPQNVAKTCPKRTIALECFHRADIDKAMKALSRELNACHPLAGEPVMVNLTVETKGGRPTCVSHRPTTKTGACAAKVVARYLTIPGSKETEQCQFKYPIRYDIESD
ncbi:MAG: hypothetical protein ACON3Z_04675 [Bradymonadia bacterium]